MKVILLQDVAKVGRRYEVKEVADGFGRNFLISRQMALVANPQNLARLETLKKEAGASAKQSQTEFKKTLEKLADTMIKIEAKASEAGHLFASLHAADISEAVVKQTGLPLHADAIQLDYPIKALGEHEIKLKQADLEGRFKLLVEALAE